MIDLLVVGGDSMIGGAVARAGRARGWSVVATTRRVKDRAGSNPYFDLASPGGPALPQARVALLAAARPGEICEKEPEESRRVNVAGTISLIERLAGEGSRVVFLSTDKVFDGAVPRRLADDVPCPLTEYGRQKAAGERAALESGTGGTVMRLTKVVGPAGLSILADWATRLRDGAPINAFDDLTCAPISLDFAADALVAVLESCGSGVYQISGERDVTWYEIARGLARALDRPESLVRPASAACALGAPPPVHTTLDSSRMVREFGLAPPPVGATIDAAIASIVCRLSNAKSST